MKPTIVTKQIRGVNAEKSDAFNQQARLRSLTNGQYLEWLLDHAVQVEAKEVSKGEHT